MKTLNEKFIDKDWQKLQKGKAAYSEYLQYTGNVESGKTIKTNWHDFIMRLAAYEFDTANYLKRNREDFKFVWNSEKNELAIHDLSTTTVYLVPANYLIKMVARTMH